VPLVLAYLAWVLVNVLCFALGRQLGLPHWASGLCALILFGALAAAALVRSGRQPARVLTTAFWITKRGLATGYHQTDLLTPDGALVGFDHNDFERGSRETYRVLLDAAWVATLFERLGSKEFSDLAPSYSNPAMCDGFCLQIGWCVDGRERSAYLENTDHRILSPLVREIWSHAPHSVGRFLPVFGSHQGA
jgi:hypothetical protein